MLTTNSIRGAEMRPGNPWEWTPTSEVPEIVREDRVARQEWYSKNPWHFYTGVEGVNPNLRVGDDNPARRWDGAVLDFDVKMTVPEILALLERHKGPAPSWLEESLGRKYRLVWLFEQPMPIENNQFFVIAAKLLLAELKVKIFPGLDEGAYKTASRLYANGGVWHRLAGAPLSRDLILATAFRAAREFDTVAGISSDIPLSEVWAAVQQKFPKLRWPSEFVIGSQGPSFWVPGSESPMSAIVKKDGMFTFAAHAEKPFFHWRDILGSDFVRGFEDSTIAKATEGIFAESGGKYWRAFMDHEKVAWRHESKEEVVMHLRVDAKLSAKPGPGGEPSLIDQCMQFARNRNWIDGAAPLVFRPYGISRLNGLRILNRSRVQAMPPAPGGATEWGDGFPWIGGFLPFFFVSKQQFDFFRCWLARGYQGAIRGEPEQCQAIFFSGGAGTGKTLCSNCIVGGIFGGAADVTNYLLNRSDFNSELFMAGMWCVDDDTINRSTGDRKLFAAMVKRTVANRLIRVNEKHQKAIMVDHCAKLIITMNDDERSREGLVDTDISMMDKVALLRTVKDKYVFPDSPEMKDILERELPHLCRYLLHYQIPREWRGDARFGIKTEHNEELLESARQSSDTATFLELLLDFLRQFFADSPKNAAWVGTTTNLVTGMCADPSRTQLILKSYPPAQVSRLLKSMQAQGTLRITCATHRDGLRYWTILKSDIPGNES